MYYSEFPYYQNYYQFYNYLPSKYGYNAAFAHQQLPNSLQATSSPQCQVGLGKQPQRKSKEGAILPGVNSNQGQLLSSTGSSGAFSSNQLAIDRQENKESELYKQQIVQWLKSMDIDQRFEVFMIKDKWFAQTIIKMFWKQKTGGDSAFALYSEEEKKDRFIEDRQRYHQKLGRQAQGLINSANSSSQSSTTLAITQSSSTSQQSEGNSAKQLNNHTFNGVNNSITDSSNSDSPNGALCIQNSSGNSISQNNQLVNSNGQASQGYSQFSMNSNSSQENLSHYQSLLQYWRSMNSSKKRKILNKGSEIHKILSNNSQIEGLEKNDKQLEWYKKKKDQFYQKQKLPNDEEIQQNLLQFLDDLKAEKFIDQLCFTSLEETTSVITIVLKKMHEKLNEMYSEQIAQYLIHNDELEKNVKKKKNNTQSQSSSNGGKKKKKNGKKSKGNAGGSGNNGSLPPIKETTFAEEVSLMHQQQLLQEQQENQKQQEKLFQQQQQLQKEQQLAQQANKQQAPEKTEAIPSVQARHQVQTNENVNKNEENSSSLENSKKSEVSKGTSTALNTKKKTTSGNMPLVLKMQQQKKNEYLEVCCQQNKCEMIDLTKSIAQKLISSCIQAVDTFTKSNDDVTTQNSILIQNAYETDQSSSFNLKQVNSTTVQSGAALQQSVAAKKKKKTKNGTNQVVNESNANTNNKSKAKKKQETLTENDERKGDIENEDERVRNNANADDDTEELPIQNYSDSDQEGHKKGSEIHSDNTTIDCQYGISSVITISSNSKRKQSDSHNSNSSSRHTTKNINPFSDEDDFKQFKDEINVNKKNQQQKNSVANKQQPKQIQSQTHNETIADNDKNKKLRQGIHKVIERKQDDIVLEKEAFSLTASQCNDTICNSSIERESLVSSRSGSQMQIVSTYSLNQQNTNANHNIDDSDFIQVGGKKKNHRPNQQNQQNNNSRRNMNNNNNQNGQNGRKNNNNNNNNNLNNINSTNGNNNNNNKNQNRRNNRGQNDSQIQGDSRQNNHQNALRNPRNQNDANIVLSKANSTVSQISQQEKPEEEQNSQSTSTQSRFNQNSQNVNTTNQQKEEIKLEKMSSSTTSVQSSSIKKSTTQSVQILKKPQKNEQKPIAINTIDILTTKEEEDATTTTQEQILKQTQLSTTLTLQNQQSAENKPQQSEDTKSQQLKQLKLQQSQSQPIQNSQIQPNNINTITTSTTTIQSNTDSQNPNFISNQPQLQQQPQQQQSQSQSTNNKYTKLTPVKKQKIQILQKSPLSLNAEKFSMREEYVQKNQLIQQNSQPSTQSNATTSSSLKENVSNDSTIAINSPTTQAQVQSTQPPQQGNQKKNQVSRKKSNQNAVAQGNNTESYVIANPQSRKNNNNNANFQNQWKDTPDSTNPPVVHQSHNNKTKLKIAKRLFRRKITNDILSFTEMINIESYRHQPSRYLIFYRIQHLLKKQFEKIESQVDLRIFGSCATGLSLPTSDIDLGITGFECHPRSDLIFILGQLANILEQFKWVKSIERIFTASIPIIKMEVDPFIDFKDCQNLEELGLFFDPVEIQSLNMPLSEENQDLRGIKLKVDITVECQMQSPNTEILNHMGFLSTDFVVRWMSYYVRLQPMTIVMKCFLHARNLNTNFKGGISSYCLLIMIIAFFRDNQNISQSDDYSNIMTSFLKYYGTVFNPDTTGISLVNGNPFFPCVKTQSQSKLQVVDPLTSKIMTQNTYLIDEILKEFSNFHAKLNEFSKKVEKQLDKMTYDQIERLDHMDFEEQKEELNILFEKNVIESIINEVDNNKTELYEKIFKQEQQEHNKNTSVLKIQESPQKSVSDVNAVATATASTQLTNTNQTTTTTNKKSKNHSKYNKINGNRLVQKEQVQ